MPAEPLDRQGLDPDEIASHAFTKSRKGYEVDEVRAYLVGLSSKLREALQQHADLTRRLAEVERRTADPRDLDEEAVTEILGEETARVLVDARKAAADIRQRAESEAEATIGEADATATATREAADQYAAGVRNLADEAEARIREEADQYAAAVREAADTETGAQRTEAEEYASNLRSEAEAEVAALRSTTAAEVEAMRTEAGSVLADRTAEAEVAAKAIRDDADEYVTRVREEADSYAEATRAAADSYRSDTQAAADTYREEAQAEGDRLRAEAEEAAARVRAEIEAEQQAAAEANEAAAAEALDEARETGRQMVQEAKDYRERVIADLADRRRAARSQLERLASVRDAVAVTLTDVVTKVEDSHRSVVETSLDIGEVGDLSIDRRTLEAGDESEPEPEPEAEGDLEEGEADAEDSPEEPDDDGGDGDDDGDLVDEAVTWSDSAEVPTVAVDVVEVDEVDEARDEARDEGADEGSVESADAADGVDSGDSVDSDGDGPEEGRDIDDLFARIRADATDPESSDTDTEVTEPEPAEPAPEPDETADVEGEAEEAEDHAAEDDAAKAEDAEVEDAEGVDPDQELLDLRDATTDEIERQLARRLKRVLSDEQNEALDLLRRTRGTPDPAEVLPSEDDHLNRYREAVLEELTAAERAGAGFYGDPPRRKAEVSDVAAEFAAEMMRRVRTPLERSFEAGDEQEVEDRIRTLYREWKTQRIADVARHYVVVAFSRGVAEAAGDGAEFRWLVDHGGDAAPDCDDNALAGPVAKGTEFPTGDLCPPAHPGCRCLAVLVDS